MSSLPRITEFTRERISREFDDLGLDACMAEVTHELRRNNPELLEMACKWANDLGEPIRMLLGFAMFYRLLVAQSAVPAGSGLSLLPAVTPETRDRLVAMIDDEGSEIFTMAAVEQMERDNPELLQMVHNFATSHADYLRVMQGFALLYRSLVVQSAADRALLN